MSKCLGCHNTLSSNCIEVLANMSCVNFALGDNLTTVLNAMGAVLCSLSQSSSALNFKVEASDGSPSYSSINTLQFIESEGFTITNPVSGTARIGLSLGFDQLNDTFSYAGNIGAIPIVNPNGDALIPFYLFGTNNVVIVDAVTTGNIALTGVQNLDGQTGTVGDKVLVWQQTTQTQNGVYTMAAGAWSRSTDSDTSGELDNQVVVANYVLAGSTYGGSYFNQVTVSPTIGVSNILYEIGGIGGSNTFWNTGGNTVGAGQFIGSNNAADFLIKTTGVERIRVLAAGDVGINITAPTAKLHIKGIDDSATYALKVQNLSNTHSLYWKNDGGIYRNGDLWSIPAVSDSNVSWGYLAGNANGGLNNTYIGSNAGILNTGSSNVFIGHNTGFVFTTGTQTTIIGTAAGAEITTGTKNTLIGYHAGQQQSTVGTGSENVIIGNNTGRRSSGSHNILLGSELGETAFITGDYNVILSDHGMTSSNNVTACVILGYGAQANGRSSSIGFGYGVNLLADNEMVIGSATNYINKERTLYSATGTHTTFYGIVTPESAVVGTRGDLYFFDDGATGEMYIKATGTATNTGWKLITHA